MPGEIPRHILCPVDLSELSASALRYAHVLASCGDARVTAFYAAAIPMPPYFTESQLEQLARQFRESSSAAEASLARFVQQTLGAGARNVGIRVVEAPPVQGILRAAEETGAELIAMGTHGRSGWNRWVLGSVAEGVLHQSKVPVLTARGTLTPATPVSIRHILCPVNDSAIARKSFQLASKLAACFDAAVTVLHVKENNSRDSIGDLCSWVSQQERPQCRIHELTRDGEPAREILTVANETGCDLLVLGAQHRLFFDGSVIGTTTVRVVRHAPCPVLTVVDWPQ